MNRRTFLSHVAATPFVFGLGSLFGQDEKSPDWFTTALKRMRQTGRNGIVIIGYGDDHDRQALGTTLSKWIEKPDNPVRELLAESVVICLTAPLAKELLKEEKENCLLIDASRKRLARKTLDFDKKEEALKSIRSMLHDHLKDTVAALKAGLPEKDVKVFGSAIDDLDTDGKFPEASEKLLVDHADRIAPWLSFAALDAVHEIARRRYRKILRDTAAKLPYGVKPEVRRGGGCGDGKAPVPCGRARVSPNSRNFLRFLSK